MILHALLLYGAQLNDGGRDMDVILGAMRGTSKIHDFQSMFPLEKVISELNCSLE